MASCPTTLVVYTEDRINFPIKHALVLVNQLFQYGVKEIVAKDDKIFIKLTYSPRAATLRRKFGSLPIRYMRTKIQNNEEFKILENVCRRYKFNLLDEEDDGGNSNRHQLTAATAFGGVKRKLAVEEEVYLSSEEEEQEQQQQQQTNKDTLEDVQGTSSLLK